MMLNNQMQTEICANFQRSKRLDSDTVDDGYVLTGTACQALQTMAENLLHSKQRAFTWTGPYGCGKSSLALLLASLVGKSKERESVERLIPTGSVIREAFCANKGWEVIRIVGRQELITNDLGSQLGVIGDGRIVLDALRELAVKKKAPDGVIILIDEAGKYLEAGCASENAYFLQELAETACRVDSKVVVVGIFHQAMDVYASRLPFALRDEWSKVQGRFIDIPLAATANETLELLSKAIVHPIDWQPPQPFLDSVTLTVRAITQGRGEDDAQLARQLTTCWPLNPVTTLLLGPVSRRKFSQNERSIYSFLSALEPAGFAEFLNTAELGDLYSPARYWDYLQTNFESSIMATGDGHRWMTACDAVMRAENLHSAALLDLAKTVAVIDLFRLGSRIQASEEVLAAAICTSTNRVRRMLAELVKKRVLVERRHMNAWAVYAGSDFDLEVAIKEAYSHQNGLDVSAISQLVTLEPIVAREHYLRTGTMRWFDCRLMTSSSLTAISQEKSTDTGAVGEFILVIPDDLNEVELSFSRENILRQWVARYQLDNCAVTRGRCLVLGFPANAERIRDLALDLQAISVVARDPSLEGDDTGRNEVRIRQRHVRQKLIDELGEAFTRAMWFGLDRVDVVTNQLTLLQYASRLCDEIYPTSPKLVNELINRDHLSTNISKARRELLYAMLARETEAKLGFDGFPPAYALYLSMLVSLHRCQDNVWGFAAKPVKGKGGYRDLWDATEEFLKSRPMTSLDELFSFWRKAPFGLKFGPMPILALAYYLGNRDSIAVYVGGSFQADFTSATIDEWLVDSSRVAFRYIERGNAHRILLNKLASKLAPLVVAESVVNNALSVGRAIVGLILSAPAFSRRSINFDHKTISLRNIALKASDPIQFLFRDIPAVYGTEDPDVIANGVEASLKEFLEAMPKMVETVRKHLYQALQVEDDNLSELNSRAEAIKGLSGNMVQEAFVSRLSIFKGTESDVTGLISLATNRPAQFWTDRDVQLALSKIDELSYSFRQQETFATLRGREGNRRVFSVTVASGSHDLVQTIDLNREESETAASYARTLLKNFEGLDPKVALGVLAELGILINKHS